MEKAVIGALLSGQSSRQIAGWLKPPLHFSSINRYYTTVVKPTMENAERLKSVLPEELRPIATPAKLSQNDATEIRQITQQAILAAPALQIRENRIRLNQDIANRLMTVVNERAADMSVCERCRQPASVHPFSDPEDSTKRCLHFIAVPGGTSGLIVRKLKKDGFEYAVDTGLLGEVREYQRQTAIELGQWQEGVTGQVSIQIVCPSTGSAPEQMPRISFQTSDTLELPSEDDDGILEIGVLQKNE